MTMYKMFRQDIQTLNYYSDNFDKKFIDFSIYLVNFALCNDWHVLVKFFKIEKKKEFRYNNIIAR